MVRIVHIVSDNWNEYNSSHFRVTALMEAFKNDDRLSAEVITVTEWNKGTPFGNRLDDWGDIFVLQRVLMNELLPKIQVLQKMGKTFIVDWDDAYDLIGDENAAYNFWGKGEYQATTNSGLTVSARLDKHPVDQMKNNLPLIDAATMPSKLLASDWESYIDCNHLPNFLPDYYLSMTKLPKDVFVLGWGGSLSHLTSFKHSGIEKALSLYLEPYESQLLICGDQRIIEQLPFHNNVAYQPYVTWMDWTMVQSMFDIGLAPLAGEYDARRSWLKVAEYIACGIPFVATKSAPYEDFFSCDSGVFVDQGDLSSLDNPNPAAWYAGLVKVRENYSSYYEKAQINREKWWSKIGASQNRDAILSTYLGAMK